MASPKVEQTLAHAAAQLGEVRAAVRRGDRLDAARMALRLEREVRRLRAQLDRGASLGEVMDAFNEATR